MIRKNWLFITVASLGITFSLPTMAQKLDDRGYEKVRMNDIPDAAQRTIKREANGKEIKELVAIHRNNEVWYQARVEDKGADKYISVGRDGKVQNIADADKNNANRDRLSDVRETRRDNDRNDHNRNDNNRDGYEKVRMNELPDAAERAIRREANGKDIKDLVAIHRNNETWYQARIDDKGHDKFVSVGRDGRVQNISDKDWENSTRGPVRLSDVGRERRGNWDGWKRDRIDPDHLPGEVKNALGKNDVKLNHLSEAWVNERNGQRIYHVIEHGPSRDTEYRVSANGRFLGEDNVTEEGRDRVDFAKLPGEVKATFKKFGKEDDFRRVNAITRGDRTFYEGKLDNGDTIRVGKNGDVMDYDRR